MMEITLSKKAAKTLDALDKATQRRIVEGIYLIPSGNIKPLQGYLEGRFRLRIGKYRIVFRYTSDDALYIIDIGSRGDIYK